MLLDTVTDYVVCNFREELALWFDVNDHVRHSDYINDALITDGASYVCLYFSHKRIGSDYDVAVPIAGTQIWLGGLLRYDSRIQLSKVEFDKIAIAAVARFLEFDRDRQSDGFVSLLSFEFDCEPWNDRHHMWLTTVTERLGGRHRDCPEYSGTLLESPGFEVIRDPRKHWAQINFAKPLDRRAVADVFGSGFVNVGGLTVSSNTALSPTQRLIDEYGITSVRVLTRRY